MDTTVKSQPMQDSEASEPTYTKSIEKINYPWFLPTIDKYLKPETRSVLEHYSKVPPDEQSEHVHQIRERAWAIRAYPCTGLGVWLIPAISSSSAYDRVLSLARAPGAVCLDVGCFLGHDLRRLAFDGVPSSSLYGVDIVDHWDLGYDLFRDRDRFQAHFIEADILDTDPGLEALNRRVDVLSIFHVLHQWSWNMQLRAVKRLCAFSKPGTIVIGHQVGNVQAKTLYGGVWRHTPASMEELLRVASAETGTEWRTEAWVRDFAEVGWDKDDITWLESGAKVIEFAVTRVA